VHIRTRKLIGTVALIVLAATWSLVAMALAQSALTSINGAIAFMFYVVAGVGWVLPAMPIVAWMQKPNRSQP
jgi:hypothetical protein